MDAETRHLDRLLTKFMDEIRSIMKLRGGASAKSTGAVEDEWRNEWQEDLKPIAKDVFRSAAREDLKQRVSVQLAEKLKALTVAHKALRKQYCSVEPKIAARLLSDLYQSINPENATAYLPNKSYLPGLREAIENLFDKYGVRTHMSTTQDSSHTYDWRGLEDAIKDLSNQCHNLDLEHATQFFRERSDVIMSQKTDSDWNRLYYRPEAFLEETFLQGPSSQDSNKFDKYQTQELRYLLMFRYELGSSYLYRYLNRIHSILRRMNEPRRGWKIDSGSMISLYCYLDDCDYAVEKIDKKWHMSDIKKQCFFKVFEAWKQYSKAIDSGCSDNVAVGHSSGIDVRKKKEIEALDNEALSNIHK